MSEEMCSDLLNQYKQWRRLNPKLAAWSDKHQPPPPHPADTQTIADIVDCPIHYTSHPSGTECITITEHMSFLRGNAIKYLWRADHKNGLEDLRKARWYIDREIANLERGMKQ